MPTPTPPPAPQSGDAFLQGIQQQLMNQSSIISSTNSDLESNIQSAIAGVQSATDSESQRIDSQYSRQMGYVTDQGNQSILEGRAAQTGGLFNISALRTLTDTVDKSLQDLQQRKEELILQNNAAGASKIADLQLQSLQFRQQAQQQVFSNLLGMANFGLQSQQEQRLQKAQTFEQNKSMADIALQYGVKLNPGDTLESVVTRAMPFASQKAQAELAQTIAQTRKANADAASIMGGGSAGITPESTSILAHQWNVLSGQNLTVDTSKEMENILGKYAKAGREADFYTAVAADKVASVKAQVDALNARNAPAPSTPTKTTTPSAPRSNGSMIQRATGTYDLNQQFSFFRNLFQ